jgi:hypothetical protein
MSEWVEVVTNVPTGRHFEALFGNRIGALRVPGFVDPAVCASALRNLDGTRLDHYVRASPRIGRIGITQVDHRGSPDGQALYFDRVAEAREACVALLDGFDLTGDVIDTVGGAMGLPTSVATDDHRRPYFAGVVRVIDRILPHADFAPYDAADWSINAVDSQLSWNVYLGCSSTGGAARVYRRQWTDGDDRHRDPGNYSHSADIVEGCEYVELAPRVGDLTLFNSRNFHEVDASGDHDLRVTLSSFIGRLRHPDRLVFWS